MVNSLGYKRDIIKLSARSYEFYKPIHGFKSTYLQNN
jgi:hypothetical protein